MGGVRGGWRANLLARGMIGPSEKQTCRPSEGRERANQLICVAHNKLKTLHFPDAKTLMRLNPGGERCPLVGVDGADIA